MDRNVKALNRAVMKSDGTALTVTQGIGKEVCCYVIFCSVKAGCGLAM